MAVTIKTTNYAFLEKVGVNQAWIEALKAQNIKLALGFYDLKLIAPNGVEVGAYKLPKNTNDLMKGTVGSTVLSGIQGALQKVISEAVQKVKNGDYSTPVQMTDPFQEKLAKSMQETDSAANIPANMTGLSDVLVPSNSPAHSVSPTYQTAGKSIKEMLMMQAVTLKQASMMYQPVAGSSKGSRYFVVALNSMCKVAARIQGQSVSIRVEGTLPDTVRMAFVNVSVEDHGAYMSGHFECNDKVTPERLIGAVLMGTGLQFDTPMPSLSAIKNVK